MTTPGPGVRPVRTQLLVAVAIVVGLSAAMATRLPRGAGAAAPGGVSLTMPEVVQSSPAEAVRSILAQLHAQLRAVARGDAAADRALREAAVTLVDTTPYRAEVERQIGPGKANEERFARALLVNWGAMLSYYQEGLETAGCAVLPGTSAATIVRVPLARDGRAVTLLVECRQGDDGLWRVQRMRFDRAAPAAETQPGARPAAQ